MHFEKAFQFDTKNQQKISDAIKLKKWKENMNLVSLCECFYYDLDVTQNALEKASAGGKYTTAARWPFLKTSAFQGSVISYLEHPLFLLRFFPSRQQQKPRVFISAKKSKAESNHWTLNFTWTRHEHDNFKLKTTSALICTGPFLIRPTITSFCTVQSLHLDKSHFHQCIHTVYMYCFI